MLQTKEITINHWYRCLWKGCEELCCIRIENKDEKNNILYGIHTFYNDRCIMSGDLKFCKSILYQIIDQTYYTQIQSQF